MMQTWTMFRRAGRGYLKPDGQVARQGSELLGTEGGHKTLHEQCAQSLRDEHRPVANRLCLPHRLTLSFDVLQASRISALNKSDELACSVFGGARPTGIVRLNPYC